MPTSPSAEAKFYSSWAARNAVVIVVVVVIGPRSLVIPNRGGAGNVSRKLQLSCRELDSLDLQWITA